MKILLVNDDGIKAKGIETLFRRLKNNFDVSVVAPKFEMSSVGHHLSMRTPVFCEKFPEYGENAFALTGTPVDCVKFAVKQLNFQPDLVISGINKGANVGSDVVYSGTVSAAVEANILGIPSVAVSSASYDDDEYGICADFIFDNLQKLYKAALPDKVINVNVPDSKITKIRGVKVAQQSIRDYGDHYVEIKEGFFVKGTPKSYADHPVESDVKFLDLGYITITPLTYSMTHFESLKSTEELFK